MPRPLEALVAAASLAMIVGCIQQDAAAPGTADTSPTAASPAAAPNADPAAKPAPASAEVTVTAVTPEELRAKIAENKGKAVLVDFWATWCVNCRKEYPHTVALSKKYDGDLVVYSVSMDETDEETLALIKKALAPYADGNVQNLRSAQGSAEEVYTAFEITGGALPHYKVFGRDGRIVQTFGGSVDGSVEPEQIDAAVAKALGET